MLQQAEKETLDEFTAYVEKHELETLFTTLIHECFLKKIEEPKQFIVKYLTRKDSDGIPKTIVETDDRKSSASSEQSPLSDDLDQQRRSRSRSTSTMSRVYSSEDDVDSSFEQTALKKLVVSLETKGNKNFNEYSTDDDRAN